MTKYKLTDETKTLPNGVVLRRIELTEDCRWGKAGDKGGWIEKESNLQGNAWVFGDAEVFGDAKVSGYAEVYGNVRVYESEEEYTMEELEKIVGHKFKIK